MWFILIKQAGDQAALHRFPEFALLWNSANDWLHVFCRVAGTEAVTSEQRRHVWLGSLILKEVLWSDSLSVVVVMANAENQTQRLRYRVWLQKLLSSGLLWIQVGCSGVTNNQQHCRKQAAQPAVSFKAAVHPKYKFSQTPEEAGDSFSKLN